MKSPKKSAKAKGSVKFKDLASKKDPRGGGAQWIGGNTYLKIKLT